MLVKPEVKVFDLDNLSPERFSESNVTLIECASIMDAKLSVPQTDERYKLIINVRYLCRSRDSIFVLSVNYASINTSANDKSFILNLPFGSFKTFINYDVTNTMIEQAFQHFITDMKIKYNNSDSLSNTKFSIFAADITNTNIKYDENITKDSNFRLAKFDLTPEVYSLFAFVDYYMTSGMENNSELKEACKAATISEDSTKIIDAKNVKVLKLFNPDKKYKNIVVALLEIMVGDNGEDKYKLLMDFDYENICKAKKFKNNESLDKCLEEYYKEPNEYKYTFSFTDTIGDDSYIIAYCYNNNLDNALFAFNNESINSIINQIEER